MISEMRKDDTADRAKQSHLEQLFFDTEFKESLIKILDSHIWLVFKNITDTPYYTSDHPVVKTPHVHHENPGLLVSKLPCRRLRPICWCW